MTTGEKNSISHHPLGPGHGEELEYSNYQLLGFPHVYAIQYSWVKCAFYVILLQWLRKKEWKDKS
jgi:hypothetical protein